MAKKFRSLLTANACAVLLGSITPATAQEEDTLLNMQMIAGCQPTELLEDYSQEFGEIPFVGGPGVFRRWDGEFVRGDFKMYVNPDSSTFTAIVEFPLDGISCIVIMGDNLQPIVQGQPL